ncbi:MAG: PQQ-binding-like beta-propeller repeat protein [Acidimicrobiaceae bacterium]|nr:PQQ-binding-like beta-propeller repeat protein [Acidimicrobiaceae bacterium]
MMVRGIWKARVVGAVVAALIGGMAPAIAGAASVQPLVTAPTYTWPEAHQESTLHGVNADPAISTSSASSLGVRWMTYLGAPALASPIAAWNGNLSETLVFTANETGRLSAYDASDGRLVWSQYLGSAIRSTPLAEGAYLWVAPTKGGRIFKLNAATGATVCSAPVTNAAMETVNASPVLATPPGGTPTVYIAVNDFGDNNGPITAVNEQDCSTRFQVTSEPQPGTGGTWDFLSYGVSATGEGLVLYGTADPDSAVYADDAATGKLVWRYAVQNPAPKTFDIGAGVVVSPPKVNGFADGVAYVQSKFGVMYALDLTTGALIWSFNVGSPSLSTAALSGTNLVFGTETDGVFDVNAVTGKLIWHHQDSAGIDSAPAVVGPGGHRVVAFGDYSGAIDVLSLADGSVLYSHLTGGYIVASPAETDGNLLEASGDGFLYDLAPGGGNVTPPSTAVTSPADGASVANPDGRLTITGSASAAAGVGAVTVSVQRSDGLWWDAATGTWTAAPFPNRADLSAPGSSSTKWSRTFPVPTSGDTYQVLASAVSHGIADTSIGSSPPTPARVSFHVQASTSAPELTTKGPWVAPGGTIAVEGSGFASGESVDITLGTEIIAKLTASAQGTVASTSVTAPATTPFGPAALVATGVSSGNASSAPIYVTNAWTQQGSTSTHTADDPNDQVFNQHLSVSSGTYLTKAFSYSTGSPIASSAVVNDHRIYVADRSGTVSAINLATGRTAWTYQLAGGTFATSPALAPGALVVVVGAGGTVVALNQFNGKVAWTRQLAAKVQASPATAGNSIYVGTDNGRVIALKAGTGTTEWSTSIGGSVKGTPAVDTAAGLVVAGTTAGNVKSLNMTTGAVKWSVALGGTISANAVISGGLVFIGSSTGVFTALNETTGAKAWSQTTGGPITAGAAVISNHVEVGSNDGNVYWLNPTTGSQTYKIPVGQKVVGLGGAGPFEVAEGAGGTILGSKPNADDGHAWQTTEGTALTSAPTVVNGEVVITGQDGLVDVFTVPGTPPA